MFGIGVHLGQVHTNCACRAVRERARYSVLYVTRADQAAGIDLPCSPAPGAGGLLMRMAAAVNWFLNLADFKVTNLEL